MCGLAGAFVGEGAGDRESSDAESTVAEMLDRTSHRGPDGAGMTVHGRAVHGHVRLAVVDLTSASAQPFAACGRMLTYNGELWNHRELRMELAGDRRFMTAGDTEVLHAALSVWGLNDALPKLDGMFAFAWSDLQGTWLVRDRFGKIPLYVLRCGDRWTWASERKAWSVPQAAMAQALPAGCMLHLETGRLTRWWRMAETCHEVEDFSVLQLLDDGVRKRLRADAPVCCLVSGGLDSSLILTLALAHAPGVEAYVAVMDPRSDDLLAARRLCAGLGVRLHEVRVPLPTAASLAAACRCIELPSKTQSEIAAMCVPLAKRLASDGFKVCLSGEGADELFGGYGNMCIKAASLDDRGWRRLRVAQLQKMARGNFVRCNKAFMAAGVEVRLPFMEADMVRWVLSLGKQACPPGKKLLKDAAWGVVPDRIVCRPKTTFQGGSGMAAAAAMVVADPKRFYGAEVRHAFGGMVHC